MSEHVRCTNCSALISAATMMALTQGIGRHECRTTPWYVAVFDGWDAPDLAGIYGPFETEALAGAYIDELPSDLHGYSQCLSPVFRSAA